MKSLDYKIVSQTRLRTLKRTATKLIKVKMMNTGSQVWHSVAIKDVSEHLVVKLSGEEPNPDFRYRPGRNQERTDRKFHSVKKIASSSERHPKQRAAPGETVELYLQLIPKKYSTQGWHQVRLQPAIREVADNKVKNTGNNIFTWVYIRSDGYFWFHLKRTMKMKFSKPGQVTSVYENRAYKKQSPSEQSSHMPVVMALWQRIENLPSTVKALKNQNNAKPVLYLWNNNPQIASKVERIAARTTLPIKIYHSQYNIGGFGRFYLAKDIALYYVKILFIDDDQLLAANTVSGFAREFEPQTIKGYWSYKFMDSRNYWRKRVIAAGQNADYIGTGGMLVDAQIFSDTRVFECPKRFWFIEDVWISFVASHYLGWKTSKTKTTLQIEDDGKDQLNKLIDRKTRMLKYLLKKGWKLKLKG